MEYTLYKISCLDLNIDFIYIGSTQNFTRRKNEHKNVCRNINSKKYNLKIYETIRANGDWINWEMKPIEKITCNKTEACIRENFHMMEYKATLNLRRAPTGLTAKEYEQAFRKVYIINNKDIIYAKKKEIKICICGCEYTLSNYAKHCKTKKHLKLIELQV